jgi:hypothetical protein
MRGVDQSAKTMRDAEIEDFLEGFKQPTYRGMRVKWGPGGYVVEPERLERDATLNCTLLRNRAVQSRRARLFQSYFCAS